jgi:tetratricopeptide (TPR) repeat protein
MTRFIFYFILFTISNCFSQEKLETKENKKIRQDAIIQKHVYDCADKINYRIMMKNYQDCLDAGLKKDSTIAYLWQQKAMPYFKSKKYEVGMKLVDKAVKYDPMNYLDYRAFIKCIFAKTYKDAIIDFEKCIELKGNQYVQDHTYAFYIGISYLQLNEFEKAEQIFEKDIEEQTSKRGGSHFLDLFYFGISKFEQQKWEDAIAVFDQSLKQYPQFSEVQYYKAMCLVRLGKIEDAKILLEIAKKNGKLGYTINEDNAIYETYPYKKKW